MQQEHNPTEPTSQTDRKTGHGPDADRRVVSSVETDLFCEGCGYNLRTQKVWEEPTTKVLIIQCPECNKCHAARGIGGAKLAIPDRLVQLAGIGWVLFLGLLFIGTGGIEMGILLTLTEEMARYLIRNRNELTILTLGFLLPGVVSMVVSAMIAILSTSPSLKWAHAMCIVRLLANLIAITILIGGTYYYKSGANGRADAMIFTGACLLLSHYTGGIIGILFGRPVFFWLCRNLLPANIANMIRAYWSSQTIAAPSDPKA